MTAILKMRRLESTDILSFEYDPDHEELIVEFKGHRRWRYLQVPQHVINRFKRAGSFGKFFNTHIKGQFLGASV